jgi:hypothetical protein
VQVEHRRLQPFAQPRVHVEEAGAARAAQVLAAGTRQRVALEARDVEVELARRLARVQQERDAGRLGDRADLLGRVHQAALGGHVGDGDQLDVAVDAPPQLFDVQLARRVVADHLDDRAGAPGDLQERDGVAGVLRPGRQDPVAGAERERVEHRLPGARRVVGQRDVVALRAEQPGHRRVHRVQAVRRFGGGFVPADQRFVAQVLDDGVGHDGRGQCRARVVEVDHLGAARGFAARAFDVEAHTN